MYFYAHPAGSSVMSLTILYMVIARNLSDAAISQRDSFASLGMTNARLFTGQDTSLPVGRQAEQARDGLLEIGCN
jgi:hypothetical protein